MSDEGEHRSREPAEDRDFLPVIHWEGYDPVDRDDLSDEEALFLSGHANAVGAVANADATNRREREATLTNKYGGKEFRGRDLLTDPDRVYELDELDMLPEQFYL